MSPPWLLGMLSFLPLLIPLSYCIVLGKRLPACQLITPHCELVVFLRVAKSRFCQAGEERDPDRAIAIV